MSLSRSVALAAGLAASTVVVMPAAAEGPSFECGRVEPGGVERLVCDDPALARLDRKLAEVYAPAARKAVDEHPAVLRPEQIGWIRGRNDCWKDADRRACVERSYVRRIAELQARYRLIGGTGPTTYLCAGGTQGEVVVFFFATNPPTLIAERGDSTSLMFRESGADALYRGRNESFRERDGEAEVVWGFGAAPLRCRKTP